METNDPTLNLASLRSAIASAVLEDETHAVNRLIEHARSSAPQNEEISQRARRLVEVIRKGRRKPGGIDAFLQEYSLSSEEGVVLMCLAEALLRIPDGATADKLIADKIGSGDWERHLGHSSSLFVNASSYGLMLTGRVLGISEDTVQNFQGVMGRLVKRSGEPVIRAAMYHAMKIMGRQFVLGRTIKEALAEGKEDYGRGVRFSFDMLGEAARTMDDADRYFDAYMKAIEAVGKHAGNDERDIHARNSISVKLSAIHPRYEEFKRARVMEEMVPRVVSLAKAARDAGIGFTVDAEETDRLDISLDIIEAALRSSELRGWDGFGLAVQAYQKRALYVIHWLATLGRELGIRMPVRLVKGAYWDTEVKLHQILGADGYPVFTRKPSTDVSYLACAKAMLDRRDVFYPQFASHNAHTVAAVSVYAGDKGGYEFQRLHGMGEPLYDAVLEGALGKPLPLRVYAPVGSHEDLLAYLVRRLLENGANSSFVHRLADDASPIEEIIADPVSVMETTAVKPHPKIVLPPNLYGDRKNATGLLLTQRSVYGPLQRRIEEQLSMPFTAGPIVGGTLHKVGSAVPITDPSDRRRVVGEVYEATPELITEAFERAGNSFTAWDGQGGAARAAMLERVADLYEDNLDQLIALCVREAGKTIPNALADVREAIDFLRYYAVQARARFGGAEQLPGPTGEANQMILHGRGTFVCISPWNFPIAIFTGQVAAALGAGNTVLAKPAEQTPLIAARAVQLFHEAGVPGDVLALLPGDGKVGAALVEHQHTAGVAFTGSTEVARIINRTLAGKDGPIVPLIAETGGQNFMIVDSTALPEQVVRDVLVSAFDSAGQRCSACRVLAVQDDVADKVITMLKGAMAELTVGDPFALKTDIGPVIDDEARETLEAHAARMAREGKLIAEVRLSGETEHGTFFAPRAVEIASIDQLGREVFGPFLHVLRFKASELGALCDAINATGYGLTCGIHSRIEDTAAFVAEKVRVGNVYVNRNQVGAIVGCQPFGGEGLSGTGPKAGGPNYLPRFAAEKVVSTDTTASGGNAALMSLEGA